MVSQFNKPEDIHCTGGKSAENQPDPVQQVFQTIGSKPREEGAMSTLQTIQPHRLAHGLREAAIPLGSPVKKEVAAEPAGAPATVLGVVVGAVVSAFQRRPVAPAPAPVAVPVLTSPRRGIPHGAVDLPVRMRNVRICNHGRGLAYCDSHSYEALGPVPADDGVEYPDDGVTHVECAVPPDGYYDAVALVSVNGAMRVRVTELTPCC